MTETALRTQFVATAENYHGIREGSPSHRDIVELYNSHKPRPRNYKLTLSDPWCAAFVSAMAIKCSLTDIIPVECSCTRMIGLFKEMDSWEEADNYIPQPGDILFYDWADDGTGDCTGTPDHVGIVLSVNGNMAQVAEGDGRTTDGIIQIIEGNYDNAVRCREIELDGKYIRGYGVPDYASLADHKTVDELAREVIAGKWGNNPERRNKLTAAGHDAAAVQARVNEILGHTYTVRKGDTLWGIAERELGYGPRFAEIKDLNGLTTDIIHPGQILNLPEK